MRSFDHLILTRFNVKTPDWKGQKKNSWLRERIKIFEQICFPSVKNQTNQNFKWYVFFDINSPIFLKEKISNEYSKYVNFVPCYIELFNIEEVRKEIANDLYSDYLITTRLDNDDAISSNYINNIQKEFCYQDGVVLNFDFGYILDYQTNNLYKRYHYINAFCTLFERSENFNTVWVKDHRELNTIYELKNIKTLPAWIQVVHGDNISNKISKDSYRIKIPFNFCSKFMLSKNKCKEIQQTRSNNIDVYFEFTKQFFLYKLTILLRPIKRKTQDYYNKIKGKDIKFGH